MKMTFKSGRLDARGISVVELMVGVVLLSVVVISLAAASLYSSRTQARARVRLQAAEFTQTVMERVLSVPYDNLVDGSRTTEVGSAKWIIEDRYTHRQILLVTEYSPTEAISVVDTVVAYRLAP